MAYSTTRCSNCEGSTVINPSTSVSIFGSFIANLKISIKIINHKNEVFYKTPKFKNLIKCRENVVGKLDLGNSICSSCCSTNSKSCYTLFAQWCVEDSGFAMFFLQSNCAAENTTKSNIFSKYYCEQVSFTSINTICTVSGKLTLKYTNQQLGH